MTNNIFPKPRLLSSSCLGFAICRYNGAVIEAPYVAKLSSFCEIIHVCPEVEIGLGIPREPVRIIKKGNDLRLIQTDTGRDYSSAMDSFCKDYIGSLGEIDAFIMKYKSPSCGLFETGYYASSAKGRPIAHGPGLFASEIIAAYPQTAIENEKRLSNFDIREHFLIRLFASAALRSALKKNSISSLLDLHARNKLILLTYNQKNMRIMGSLLAGYKKKSLTDIAAKYSYLFYDSFKIKGRYSSHINVLQHAAGYFSRYISLREKEYINSLFTAYSEKRLPLSALRSIIKSYIIRFRISYLLDQTYFSPYPEGLQELSDTGKDRHV